MVNAVNSLWGVAMVTYLGNCIPGGPAHQCTEHIAEIVPVYNNWLYLLILLPLTFYIPNLCSIVSFHQ